MEVDGGEWVTRTHMHTADSEICVGGVVRNVRWAAAPASASPDSAS